MPHSIAARGAIVGAVAVVSLVAPARRASPQTLPPPRVVVLTSPSQTPPAALPAALRAPTRGWTDAQLRERPWLRGQTPQHHIGLLNERSNPAHDPALDEGPFEARLAAVARSYLAWGRVDDELRWAPYLCRMPSPSVPRWSGAEAGGHAQKVYFLYARDRAAYISGRAARHQVVVKESWTHRPVTPERATQLGGEPIVTQTPDGATVEPDRATGLFVMMRVDPRDPRADRGWMYGTVSPDGAVTSAGRIASCMGCHVEAGPGRLFGLGGRAARDGRRRHAP